MKTFAKVGAVLALAMAVTHTAHAQEISSAELDGVTVPSEMVSDLGAQLVKMGYEIDPSNSQEVIGAWSDVYAKRQEVAANPSETDDSPAPTAGISEVETKVEPSVASAASAPAPAPEGTSVEDYRERLTGTIANFGGRNVNGINAAVKGGVYGVPTGEMSAENNPQVLLAKLQRELKEIEYKAQRSREFGMQDLN